MVKTSLQFHPLIAMVLSKLFGPPYDAGDKVGRAARTGRDDVAYRLVRKFRCRGARAVNRACQQGKDSDEAQRST